MRIFAALLHPISDNNARVILPVQTLCTDANPAAHLRSLSWPLCPCLRLFLLVIMRRTRGATARDYKLSRRPRAHGNANREKKEDEEEEKRGKETMPSFPLFLFIKALSRLLLFPCCKIGSLAFRVSQGPH